MLKKSWKNMSNLYWLLLVKKFKFLCTKLVIFQIRFLRINHCAFGVSILNWVAARVLLENTYTFFCIYFFFFFHLLCSYNNVVNYCEENSRRMVFCYQNCSDLLWEKNVLVIKKNLWNSRLKAENLQKFWDH